MHPLTVKGKYLQYLGQKLCTGSYIQYIWYIYTHSICSIVYIECSLQLVLYQKTGIQNVKVGQAVTEMEGTEMRNRRGSLFPMFVLHEVGVCTLPVSTNEKGVKASFRSCAISLTFTVSPGYSCSSETEILTEVPMPNNLFPTLLCCVMSPAFEDADILLFCS